MAIEREEDKKNLRKGTPNKWKFLADRVLLKVGHPRKWNVASITKEFQGFVDYYSKERSVYVTKSKQKKGGSGAEVQAERVERVAPMTEISFCVWMGKDKSWLSGMCAEYEYKATEKENPTKEDIEMHELLCAIRTFLNAQLLEGAVMGEYTPNIVARLLGMRDNLDVTSNGKSAAVPVINIVADTKTREQYAIESEIEVAKAPQDPIED